MYNIPPLHPAAMLNFLASMDPVQRTWTILGIGAVVFVGLVTLSQLLAAISDILEAHQFEQERERRAAQIGFDAGRNDGTDGSGIPLQPVVMRGGRWVAEESEGTAPVMVFREEEGMESDVGKGKRKEREGGDGFSDFRKQPRAAWARKRI